MLQERPHFYDRHVAGTVSKFLNKNGFGEATLFWCMVSTFWFILDGDWSSYF
jgi:hypothetical protein